VPTDGVATDEFTSAGIWPVTAAVGAKQPDTEGITWVWVIPVLELESERVDISNPVNTTGVSKLCNGCRVVTEAKLILLNIEVETAVGGCTVGQIPTNDCCGPPKVGTLDLAFTTETVVVSVDTT